MTRWALIITGLVLAAILVGRLLYWQAGLPLRACELVVAPTFGAAIFGIAWYAATEETNQ